MDERTPKTIFRVSRRASDLQILNSQTEWVGWEEFKQKRRVCHQRKRKRYKKIERRARGGQRWGIGKG